MNKFTSIRLLESMSILVMIFLFSPNIQASESIPDLNFYYIVGQISNATEPGLKCSDVTPDGLTLMLMPGETAVLDNDNFDDGDPDCNYGFAIPPNDSTFDNSLSFSTPGTYDAYFYILGPTINATPMGPCPFELSVTEMAVSTNETELSGVSVYPNPISTSLVLDYSDYQFMKLELYDSGGRMIKNEKAERQFLDVSALSTGIYILKLYFEEGVAQRKIIKE